MKPRIKEVIVVEGRYDKNALLQVVDATVEASTRANVILCFDKGQSAKAQLPLSKAQAKPRGPWAGPFLCPGALVQHPVCPSTSAQALLKRQSSAGGALRGGSPEPAQLLSLREPEAQDPTGPQAPQAACTAGAGPSDCDLYRRPLPLGHRGRAGGERFTTASRPGLTSG